MYNKNKAAASLIRYFSTMTSGLPLKEVVKNLETFAPLSYAEKWDNVGLLLEPHDQG